MLNKTHEQFLEELFANNVEYRNGEFTVLNEYQTKNNKIKVRNKFGECEMIPKSLLSYKITIQAAVNKTEYFINMCLDRFGEDGNDNLSQVEYVDKHTKIKVIDKDFGEYFILPWSYYAGTRSKKRASSILNDAKRCSQYDVFTAIQKIHPNLIILPNQNYISKTTKLLVEDKYGICEVTSQHLLLGSGPSIVSAINKNEYFTNMAKEVHGSTYDYSLVEYKNTITKVKIVSEYGVFEQTPHQHLKGVGCPIMYKNRISKNRRDHPASWSYSSWQKSAENSKYFDSYKVYFIECFDDTTGEKFYKIGRTYLKLNRRLQKSALKYNYKVVHVVELESAIGACELEQKSKKIHKNYKYLPTKSFGGMHECFSKLIINNLN